MARYEAQLVVTTSMIPSSGNGGEPSFNHQAESGVGVLSILWTGGARRRFLYWRISVMHSEGDGSVDATRIHPRAPSFTSKSETETFVYAEYDEPESFNVNAVAVFENDDLEPEPDDPYKRVDVLVWNGSSASVGEVTVNGRTSSQWERAFGFVPKDGTEEFSYTVSAAATDPSYEFYRWNDGVTSASRSGSTTTDLSFTAYFRKKHTVRILEAAVGGVTQEIRINASNVTGDYSGIRFEGETISISFTPASGTTAVIFRAVKVTSGSGSTATVSSLKNSDGQTSMTFTMPDADVLFVIGCFYDKTTVTPVVKTGGVESSAGGSASPSSASNKKNGDVVTINSNVNSGYARGSTSAGADVWVWPDNAVFDLDGASRTQNTASTSVTLRGDAAGKLTSLPSWTGMNSLDGKWFMNPTEGGPTLNFHSVANYFFVKVSFESYGARGEATPASARDTWLQLTRQNSAIAVGGAVVSGSVGSYFILGLVREVEGGARTVLYKYLGSGSTPSSKYDSLAPEMQANAARYHYHVWVWPKPTGKILYSPTKSGRPILRGSGGKPMAQFVDT